MSTSWTSRARRAAASAMPTQRGSRDACRGWRGPPRGTARLDPRHRTLTGRTFPPYATPPLLSAPTIRRARVGPHALHPERGRRWRPQDPAPRRRDSTLPRAPNQSVSQAQGRMERSPHAPQSGGGRARPHFPHPSPPHALHAGCTPRPEPRFLVPSPAAAPPLQQHGGGVGGPHHRLARRPRLRRPRCGRKRPPHPLAPPALCAADLPAENCRNPVDGAHLRGRQLDLAPLPGRVHLPRPPPRHVRGLRHLPLHGAYDCLPGRRGREPCGHHPGGQAPGSSPQPPRQHVPSPHCGRPRFRTCGRAASCAPCPWAPPSYAPASWPRCSSSSSSRSARSSPSPSSRRTSTGRESFARTGERPLTLPPPPWTAAPGSRAPARPSAVHPQRLRIPRLHHERLHHLRLLLARHVLSGAQEGAGCAAPRSARSPLPSPSPCAALTDAHTRMCSPVFARAQVPLHQGRPLHDVLAVGHDRRARALQPHPRNRDLHHHQRLPRAAKPPHLLRNVYRGYCAPVRPPAASGPHTLAAPSPRSDPAPRYAFTDAPFRALGKRRVSLLQDNFATGAQRTPSVRAHPPTPALTARDGFFQTTWPATSTTSCLWSFPRGSPRRRGRWPAWRRPPPLVTRFAQRGSSRPSPATKPPSGGGACCERGSKERRHNMLPPVVCFFYETMEHDAASPFRGKPATA